MPSRTFEALARSAWAGFRFPLLGVLLLNLTSACVLEQQPLFDLDGDGVLAPYDCHDGDPAVGVRHPDADDDGYGDAQVFLSDDCQQASSVSQGGDCDDADATRSPAQEERCNGQDDDCDGQADEDSIDQSLFYLDLDGDTFGDAAAPVLACPDAASAELSSNDDDCNDADSSISPSQDETCDDQDEDCDGVVDEDPRNGTLYYPDSDADGYGTNQGGKRYCTGDQPTATTPQSGDCNDKDNTVFPGSVESCDGQDEDCDGEVDNAPTDGQLYFQDQDGDGDGNLAAPLQACELPPGYSSSSKDCDDGDPTRSSLAQERCNGEDDDCDGLSDEDFGDSDGSGLHDCLEVAYVVSVGFVANGQGIARCYGQTNLDAQLTAMTELLGALGLTPVVYYDNATQGISYEQLAPFPVVIYDDGGWTDTPVPSTVQAFKQARTDGKGLLFMGDDLALQAAAVSTDYNDRSFFDLLWLSRLVAGGTMGRGVVALSSTHPVMQGPYGTVSSFPYDGDLDIAEPTGDETQLLATIQGAAGDNPSIWVNETAGQRSLMMLPSAFATVLNCPTSNEAGLEMLARLVKNGVLWLYAR